VGLEDSSRGRSGRDLIPHGLHQAVDRAPVRLPSTAWRLSPRAALALAFGFLAAVLLGISGFVFLPSATLQLVCRHDFRSADITVSIDGEVVHTDTLTGAVRKWFGVLKKTEGTYARTLPVSAGRHVVTVHLRAPGYDRTRSIEGQFSRGKESSLSVDSGRGLSLAWRGREGASAAEPASPSSSWFRYAGSIMMTIFGSIVSASIGVLVQDFLRSRKARLDETGPVRPQRSKKASPLRSAGERRIVGASLRGPDPEVAEPLKSVDQAEVSQSAATAATRLSPTTKPK
jgi:hypothetical protein